MLTLSATKGIAQKSQNVFRKNESFVFEDSAFFDIELDGCTWSPTSSPEIPIDQFQLEQDVLLIRTICAPSSVEEEKIIRVVERNQKMTRVRSDLEELSESLECKGYTATVCTGRRAAQDMLRNPKHEFIRVKIDEESTFIVDVGFQAFLEVARPSLYYRKLVESLPKVFIGSEDRMRCLIAFMSDQLKKNFESSGMPCPPWREKECLLNTWAL